MIDQTTLITYILIVLGFVFIPGPATVLTVARATTSGTRVGVATGLGIAVGDIIHTALAVIGLSAIILASAFLFSLIKYLGAAYLVYLGLRALFAKAPDPTSQTTVPLSPSAAFRQAILAEVLNPKTALFFLAFLPQFVKPENGFVLGQLAILGVIMVALGLFSTLIFALAAGKISNFLRTNRTVLRWQGKVVGSIYCALGLRLALQER
ncbi:LysE family translocator [Ahrensia marina]|uniref:LysE family translocator n=1 Tax=Ahrensia marina TaxID=1514904 RepID=UPI0035D13284